MKKSFKILLSNIRWYHPFLLFLFVTSIFIKMFPVSKDIFPFTFDQARDAIWVKNQFDFGQLSLIGPWGSITGIFFGPLWFWLLGIPYVLSAGDPRSYVLFNAFLVFGSIAIAALVFKKQSPAVSYFIILIGSLSLGFSGIADYASCQHLLPLLTFWLIFSYAKFLLDGNPKYFCVALFSISLMFHAEPATAAFSLPSLILIILLAQTRKKLLSKKYLLLSIIIFCVPFIPQLIFELRHNFIELHAVLAYLTGNNQSLGDILPFASRLVDRPMKFFDLFKITILNQPFLASVLFLVVSYYSVFKIKEVFLRKILLAGWIYLISLLFVFIMFPPELKGFYLDGVQMVFVLICAIIFSTFWKESKKGKLIVILYVLAAIYFNLRINVFTISFKNNFSDDLQNGSVFANQKIQTDWIYQDAGGQGFAVYTYDPAVYDYPFQYMFLWYGLNKYGYLPSDFSYLPNQVEYVQKKDMQLIRLHDKIKPSSGTVYLILEKEDRYQNRKTDWLNNFPYEKYPLLKFQDFPDQTRIEKRQIL